MRVIEAFEELKPVYFLKLSEKREEKKKEGRTKRRKKKESSTKRRNEMKVEDMHIRFACQLVVIRRAYNCFTQYVPYS